jgi:hypothetical protein
MTLRTLSGCGVALGLAVATFACSGTVLSVGGNLDGGGVDACVQKTCSATEEWDSLTCACVPSHATCVPPASCAVDEVFDSVQCLCIPTPTKPSPPSDAAPPIKDAGGPTDAGIEDVVVNPCGDYAPTCCVVSDAGCTLAGSDPIGDPCTGWTCSGGGMLASSCPDYCPGGDAAAPTCATGADCASGQVCFNESPLEVPDGRCVGNPCGTAPLTCSCAASLCNGIMTGIGACGIGNGQVYCESGG